MNVVEAATVSLSAYEEGAGGATAAVPPGGAPGGESGRKAPPGGPPGTGDMAYPSMMGPSCEFVEVATDAAQTSGGGEWAAAGVAAPGGESGRKAPPGTGELAPPRLGLREGVVAERLRGPRAGSGAGVSGPGVGGAACGALEEGSCEGLRRGGDCAAAGGDEGRLRGGVWPRGLAPPSAESVRGWAERGGLAEAAVAAPGAEAAEGGTATGGGTALCSDAEARAPGGGGRGTDV